VEREEEKEEKQAISDSEEKQAAPKCEAAKSFLRRVLPVSEIPSHWGDDDDDTTTSHVHVNEHELESNPKRVQGTFGAKRECDRAKFNAQNMIQESCGEEDNDSGSVGHEDEAGCTDAILGSRRKARNWDQFYDCLVEYTKAHGNSNVPKKYDLDVPLGHWVSKQQKEKVVLKLEQHHKLMALNFHWDTQHERDLTLWEERFDELLSYKEKHEHCRVPCRSGVLGNWVLQQRRRCKQAKLPPDQYTILSAIGFEWELKENHQTTWAERPHLGAIWVLRHITE
jgi:hypothetical protein